MKHIESQTQILNELCQLMLMSAEEGASNLTCRFDYNTSPDGSMSVGSEFSYVINGQEKSAALVYPERKKIGDLVPALHKEMKRHSGGSWEAFTLTIDEAGKATTRFEYSKT